MRPLQRVVIVCSAALFVPLLIPLATGRVFTLDDLAAYHIPTRYLYGSALRGHESILWTPALFAGYYLFGEGQVGMAHPWHLLLYRFLPLTIAFNLEIVTSYVVMFAGVVLLLRRLRFSTESRWFGAMVFTFSGYNVFHLIHVNMIAAVAHIPWILLLTDTLVAATDRKSRAQSFIALALVVASQILVGHSQLLWFTSLLVGGLGGYYLWNNLPVARVALVPLAFVTGALIAGVQLFPLLDVAAASQRSDWLPAFSLTFSLVPANVVQLWSPFFFQTGVTAAPREAFAVHEFIVYNGAFCTVALVWIAMRWRMLPRKHLTVGLLLLGAIALILAFGGYGGLYASLLEVPGLRWFRAPARHLMLLHLSLSLLAVLAFETLLDLVRRRDVVEWRRLWPLAIPTALSLGTAMVAANVMASGSAVRLSSLTSTLPWLLLFVAVPLLFAATARGASWALVLLVVIAAADQGYWGFHYLFGDRYRPLMTIDQLAEWPMAPESSPSGDRVDTRQPIPFQNALIPRGFRVWRGYVGLPPALRLNDTDIAAELAGVKWRITNTGIERIQSTVDRARLLTNASVSSDMSSDIRSIDVRAQALVDHPVEGLSGAGSVRVVDDRPGLIVVDTVTSGRQLLVLTERFESGWVIEDVIQGNGTTASSDVQPVPVYGDFLGYVVEAGVHRVTFRFRPRSFYVGALATAAGLLLLLFVTPFAIF
jgi:hypothetical protein